MTNILRFAGLALISFLLLTGCGNEPQRLPYLGNVEIKGADTVYHTVPDITLTDQDSQTYRISTLTTKSSWRTSFSPPVQVFVPRSKNKCCAYMTDTKMMTGWS